MWFLVWSFTRLGDSGQLHLSGPPFPHCIMGIITVTMVYVVMMIKGIYLCKVLRIGPERQKVLFRCMLIKVEKSRKVGVHSSPAGDGWPVGQCHTESKINSCWRNQLNSSINSALVLLFSYLKLHARHWDNISSFLHCILRFCLPASPLKCDKDLLTLIFMILSPYIEVFGSRRYLLFFL